MLYLIGGAPRCGKSKLAKKLSKKLDIPIFSTDLLRIKTLSKTSKNKVDASFPFEAMFKGDKVDRCFKEYGPIDFLNADKREARTLFKEMKLFINSVDGGESYIIEGVHLLPKYIAKLLSDDIEFVVLYLGKIDELKILDGLCRNSDKKDWILGHVYKKITLKRAASMVKIYAKYFEKEAKRYDFKFINVEDNFFFKINDACDFLINMKKHQFK
jgi:2-phosphoglycerate kinase